MFTRETMNLEKWYGKSIPVPNFSSKNFLPFVASGVGIVRSILKEKMGGSIAIRFREVNTACADFKRREIAINDQYLVGKVGPEYPKLNSDESISLILGIIVHEAAHFAYSPSTLKPWAAYIKEHTKLLFVEKVAMILGNTIEDVFIEAEVDRQTPTLGWLLDCTNRIFFNSLSLEKALKDCEGIESAPTTVEGVVAVLNILIYAKTRRSVKGSLYIRELFSYVQKVVGMTDLNERFVLSLFIYNKLMAAFKKEELVPVPDSEGEGESSASEEGSGASSPSGSSSSASGTASGAIEEWTAPSAGRALDKVKKLAEGLTATPATGPARRSDTLAVAILEKSLEGLDKMEVAVVGDELDERASIYLERTPTSSYPIEADSRYDRLAEIGRQRAVSNRPYGMDRTRGTTIRKLYRIATDQKIFAEAVPMSSYRPMQVIILLDCSGSMFGYAAYGHERAGKTMIYEAARATLGAAKGLADAHCDVAVFGHTACIELQSDVVIYKIKDFVEPISVIPSRLGSLAQDKESMRENKDGYAVPYVAKKFTSHTKRRLLIVISDGEPAAPGYHGRESIEHTKKAVDGVRAKGIDVLSISITESARKANNHIYGKENNVFNTDPNVIEQIVRSLILN